MNDSLMVSVHIRMSERAQVFLIVSKIRKKKKKKKNGRTKIKEKNKTVRRCSFLVVIAFCYYSIIKKKKANDTENDTILFNKYCLKFSFDFFFSFFLLFLFNSCRQYTYHTKTCCMFIFYT
jgi:hypothetical protein